MKCYSTYDGEVPSGVRVISEGSLTMIRFDYSRETREEEEVLVCEYVGTHDSSYGGIVNAIVSDRYPADKFQAVLANYTEAISLESELPEEKKEEYIFEYNEFQAWRKKAKVVAKAVRSLING